MPLLRRPIHASAVTAVAVTPNGGCAVSGSYDETLKLWDLASGRELLTLAGHTNRVSAVAVAPDSERVFSGSYDRTMR
jgi:WD40 repeat protein